MNRLLKESFITFAVRGLSLIIALISNIIISRLLGPSLKGSYNLTLLFINVIALLVTFGIGPANVYYAARKPDDIPALLGNSILAATLFGLSGVVACEIITFLPPFKSYLISNGVYINWLRGLILFLPLILLKFYLPGLVLSAGKIFKYNLIGFLETLSGLVAAIFLVWFFNFGITGALSTWIISLISVLFFIGLLMVQVSSNRINTDIKMFRRNLPFGFRLYPGHIAQFLNYRVDVFLVAFFLSPQEVGFYVTATVLVEKLWEIPYAIRTILLYQVAASKTNSLLITTASISRILIFFLGGLCTIIAVLSYPLINLLFGAAFLPAAGAMICLLPGVWLLGLAKLLIAYLTGIGKPEVGSFAAIISLVITISLDLILIPKLGIIGASIASSCAYFVSLSVIIIKFLQVTKLSLKEITILRREDLYLLYSGIFSNIFMVLFKNQKENIH